VEAGGGGSIEPNRCWSALSAREAVRAVEAAPSLEAKEIMSSLFELIGDPAGRRRKAERGTRKRARTTDPFTSHIAGERIEAHGRAASQRRACLVAVRTWPGSTSAELAERMGEDRHMPGRRLSELKDDGVICNGVARRCAVTGAKCLTWEPVENSELRTQNSEECRRDACLPRQACAPGPGKTL